MKKIILSLVAVLISQICFSQVGFEDVEITNFPENLTNYTIVDINNDGHNDIVTFGFSSIDWFENTGINGGFLRSKNITEEVQFVQSIVTIDVDADGDVDIISASVSDDKIALYVNDGSGNFGPQQLIATSITVVGAIQSEDMDQDGDLDVVHSSSGSLSWIENTSSTTNNFSTVTSISSNSGFDEFVDFNQDGNLDIFAASASVIVWNQNQGNYQFGSSEAIFNSGFQIYETKIADIDNDGDTDILFLSGSTPLRFYYILNNGDGTFMSPTQIQQFSSYVPDVELRISDADNDGDNDFFLVLGNNVQLIENLGSLNFSSATIVSNLIDLDAIEIDDMDTDGSVDLVMKSNSRSLTLAKGNATTLQFTENAIITSNVDNPVGVVAKDINGDGNKDIIFASEGDRKIGWYEYIGGNQVFGHQRLIHYEPGIPQDVKVFDMDGDGDLDIVSIAEGTQFVGENDSVSWFANDGSGNFTGPNYIDASTNDENKDLAVFDIDNDNDYDVVVIARTAFDGEQLFYYENVDGQGNFGSLQTIASDIGSFSKLSHADIDGDGNMDIVTTATNENTVAWYRNTDGQGTFGAQQIITTSAETVYEAVAVDVDGDGDLDMAYMSNGIFKSIYWQENTDGAGTFGPQMVITSSLGPNGTFVIAAADLDNDGDQDIITSSRELFTSDEVLWIENLDGQGTFDPPKVISTNVGAPRNITIADFEGDGDLDIFTTTSTFGRLFLHKNLGVLFNEISGYVRLNLTGSGCDTTTPAISNMLVTASGTTDTYSSFTLGNSFNGFYQIFAPAGDYAVSLASSLPDNYVSVPETVNVNFGGVDGMQEINFCIEPTGTVNDVNVIVYPSIDDPRPGFDTTYQIVFNNVGTTQLSGDIIFQFNNNKIQFLNASQTVAAQTANTVTFNYANLSPFETRTIDLNFNVFPPPTTNINEGLASTVTINPSQGDATPDDNTYTLNQTVIGSYDPNDIRVLEGDEILIEDIDKYLHYIIRFQNTGTASAINVRVDHVIDNKLDWTTMQLQSLSHPGRVEITNGSDVSFIFDNINLPDSTNDEPNSHGYITFKIKPKNSVVVGDIINAVAAIYFDFNPPIITNTASTEIVEPLSVQEFDENAIVIYPNPAKDIVVIESKYIVKKIAITDINGRSLLSKTLSNSQTEYQLHINDLSQGLYFVKIETDLGIQTQKIIKE
ncbi:MAG: T9SS type A sorting domain-containing protein [Bacteroidota bacterium]